MKTLAIIIFSFIPTQFVLLAVFQDTQLSMLARNLFFLAINATSLVFAAKYFFMTAPAITGPMIVSDRFAEKYGITDREKEVIELLLSGAAIKQIAGELDRSFKTVNNHIYNIYRKTHVSSKMELLNVIQKTG
jgi:DNA-binding NarL/FixJ family response regulator